MKDIRWTLLLLTTVMAADMCAQTCSYSLHMEDSAGDGWNGSYVTICVNSAWGGQGCHDFTLINGAALDTTFAASLGQQIVGYYTPVGGGQDEVSFVLRASSGSDLFVSPAVMSSGPQFAFTVNSACNNPPWPPYDCIGGYSIVLPWMITASAVTLDDDLIEDLDDQNRGCLSGEHAGTWWRLLVSEFPAQLGLAFQAADDANLDFAIWGPFNSVNCDISTVPIRCSAADQVGATGLGNGAVDMTEDGSGDGWLAPLDVQVNDLYIVYVDRPDSAEVTFQVTADPDYDFNTEVAGDGVVRGGELHISPLPSSDHLTITVDKVRFGSIADALGRVVWQGNLETMQTIEVGSWPAGVYFLHVAGTSHRIVVAH